MKHLLYSAKKVIKCRSGDVVDRLGKYIYAFCGCHNEEKLLEFLRSGESCNLKVKQKFYFCSDSNCINRLGVKAVMKMLLCATTSFHLCLIKNACKGQCCPSCKSQSPLLPLHRLRPDLRCTLLH